MERSILIALAAAPVLVASAESSAALLGVAGQLLDHPDIVSQFIDVTYDAETNELSAAGFALAYDDGVDIALPINDGTFSLSTTVDDTGMASGGSFSIGGTFDARGSNVLLAGSLVGFGFIDGGGQILDFHFELVGGELIDAFGGVGGVVGINLDTGVDYSGDWGESYTNSPSGPGTGSGAADTAPIPAPSALALAGLGALAGLRRRRAG